MKWTAEATTAFDKAKDILSDATMLYHPKVGAETYLAVDASSSAIGAVLQQNIDGYRPISFFSRKLTDREKKYSTFTRELLAAFEAVRYFKYFITFTEFYILSDNKALV